MVLGGLGFIVPAALVTLLRRKVPVMLLLGI
jgi:hypothetical protein